MSDECCRYLFEFLIVAAVSASALGMAVIGLLYLKKW